MRIVEVNIGRWVYVVIEVCMKVEVLFLFYLDRDFVFEMKK